MPTYLHAISHSESVELGRRCERLLEKLSYTHSIRSAHSKQRAYSFRSSQRDSRAVPLVRGPRRWALLRSSEVFQLTPAVRADACFSPKLDAKGGMEVSMCPTAKEAPPLELKELEGQRDVSLPLVNPGICTGFVR